MVKKERKEDLYRCVDYLPSVVSTWPLDTQLPTTERSPILSQIIHSAYRQWETNHYGDKGRIIVGKHIVIQHKLSYVGTVALTDPSRWSREVLWLLHAGCENIQGESFFV